MKTFFWADEPFSLKADGEFLGNFFGAAAVDDLPQSFIEIFPHSYGEPVRFFSDKRPISRKNVIFYNLKNALLARIVFPVNVKTPFRLLYQKKFEAQNILVTVYSDAGVKIVAENALTAAIAEVPQGFYSFNAEIKNDTLAVYSSGSPSFAAAFSTVGDLSLLFSKVVDKFEFNPVFRTKNRLFDLERTVVTCDWRVSENGFTPTVTDTVKGDPWRVSFPPKKTERIFFERIMNRLPVSDMLSEKLKADENRIPEYIGAFDGLLPDFCAEKGVCLYRKEEGTRPVKNFFIETENRLVSNICEI
ncbi:MAG: hypothetical protein J6Z34_06290 [Clostridia bacterium]|nr:hypothetical protein [Clostridia bacterium]